MANLNIKLLMGLESAIGNASNVAGQLLFTTDGGHIFFDTDGTAAGRKMLYKDVIDDLDALELLVGSKSVATQIQEAINNLVGGTAPVQLVTEVIAGDGITVDKTTDASKPTVSVKLKAGDTNILKKDTDGSLYVNAQDAKDYTVTVTEKTTGLSDGVAKAYQIQQAATSLDVTINIPKDMVVSSGTVQTFTDADKPAEVTNAGTYLVLTLANATSDKVYINVGDLIEYVTSGSEASDDVVIVVSTDHKVTATLSAAIKASIAKADTAVQPADLSTAVVAKKYVSGFTVDGTSGKIQVQTADLPDVSGLEWGSF